jgi:hypothetical protein
MEKLEHQITEVPPLFVNTFSAELMLRRKGGARCDGKQGVSSTSVPDVREHVRANTHPPCVSWVRVNQREQVYTNRSQSSHVIFEEQLCTLRAQSVTWESCIRANWRLSRFHAFRTTHPTPLRERSECAKRVYKSVVYTNRGGTSVVVGSRLNTAFVCLLLCLVR